MVDPISIKAGPVVDRSRTAPAGAEAVAAAAPVKARDQKAVSSEAAEISQTMAAEPPVDTDRVARIRKAIADGRFPTVPTTIADRLLALKLEWNPNDQA